MLGILMEPQSVRSLKSPRLLKFHQNRTASQRLSPTNHASRLPTIIPILKLPKEGNMDRKAQTNCVQRFSHLNLNR